MSAQTALQELPKPGALLLPVQSKAADKPICAHSYDQDALRCCNVNLPVTLFHLNFSSVAICLISSWATYPAVFKMTLLWLENCHQGGAIPLLSICGLKLSVLPSRMILLLGELLRLHNMLLASPFPMQSRTTFFQRYKMHFYSGLEPALGGGIVLCTVICSWLNYVKWLLSTV